MSTVIGVVSPADLIDGIVAVVREQPGTVVLPLSYDHEEDVPALVTAHGATVDGWLFSGVIPYSVAWDDDALLAPATYVEYTGETLVQALLGLVRAGHDITRLSIDTLPADEVEQTFAESGVPTDEVAVLGYYPGLSATEAIAFHRRHQETSGGEVVITCLSAVREAIGDEVPTVRLAPLATSVRIALRQLLLSISDQLVEDAQVALGMIQLSSGTEGLATEVAPLGGATARAQGGAHLLVTTRGPLVGNTGGFTNLPMLGRLADHHDVVHIGLGLGDTAAEAENRARHALARARVLGDVRAVLSLRDGTDMVLDAPLTYETIQTPSLPVLAKRVGFAVETLQRLQELREAMDDEPVTTRDLAAHLSVQQRTARRILQRLELAGLAERAGSLTTGHAGHPATLYTLSV